MKNYNWRIKKVYFKLISKGQKTLEIRVGYPDIKRISVGDTITFKDYSKDKFDIIRISRYENFEEMSKKEELEKAVPNVNNKKEIVKLYQKIYPRDKEKLGVYVFEIRKKEKFQIIKLSTFIKNDHVKFVEFAKEAYRVTDFICKDYPKHFEWYWGKQIPRVLEGKGEVIILENKGKVAGVAFLKKDNNEKKIATFLICEEYRKKGLAKVILENSFEFLGTKKPLITIADYKVKMFDGIIKKYNWKFTRKLESGYYNDNSIEYVFNES